MKFIPLIKQIKNLLFFGVATLFISGVFSESVMATNCASTVSTDTNISVSCDTTSSNGILWNGGNLAINSGVTVTQPLTSPPIYAITQNPGQGSNLLSLTNNGIIASGYVGINANGLSYSIINSGAINTPNNSNNYGISVNASGADGVAHSIENFGSITGGGGIVFSSPNNLPLISNSGTITASGGPNRGGDGILVYNPVTTINNSGNINVTGCVVAVSTCGDGIYIGAATGAVFNAINNSGSISAGFNGILNASSTITTLTNNGTIHVNNGGINNAGSITTINTTNSIYGDNFGVYNTGSIGSLSNSSSITAGARSYSTYGILNNGGTIVSLINAATGSIGGGGAYGLSSSGAVTTISNLGTITGTAYGILNSGTVVNLNNAQGGNSANAAQTALTYNGVLPNNYNIIINNPNYYGQLLASGASGPMAFGIYGGGISGVPASTVVAGIYADIFQGLTGTLNGTTITGTGFSITNTTGTYGTSSNAVNYSLVADTAHAGMWNLVVASNMYAGTIYQTSNLGTITNPVFDGGTLQVSSGGTVAPAFTITSNNGIIDQNGLASTFSGVISNAVTNTPGSITITNGGAANVGSVTFDKINTYTGSTTINSGAKLALSGVGSISASSGVVDNGTLDISGASSTTTLKALSGSGAVVLGAQNLTVSNASGNFSGVIGGTGGFGITGGSQILSGTNTYSGFTFTGAGTTLALSGVGSIAASGTFINNGVFDISNTANGASVKAISGTGAVVLGTQNLTVSNASGNLSGAISGAGDLNIAGSIMTLSGANTFTGSTGINSGSTLFLSGAGSIATSSGVANSGTFDISNTTSGASIKAISGTGAVALGTKNLSVTNAAGNLSGAVTGSGAINITGGNQTLSGNNSTFTGGVQVQSGAALTIPAASALGSGTLALVGSSSVPATLNVTGTTTIANAITVAGDPVFNVSAGTTSTVSSPITNGGVAGDVVVAGGGILNLTAVNTYTGTTSVGSGSTLALAGAGSIATSSGVTNNGTFNIAGKTGNVSVASYNQGSTGALLMGFAPTNTQQLNITGVARLAGALSLTAGAGTYAAGKYTLLTANGVSGTFGSLSSNLNTYTNLAYSLSYDANDVYLNLYISGPSTADTQQSLANSVQAVQSTFTILNTALANSFSYDCNEFGTNGICISAGGRNTAVSAANGLNNTSALLIAAYRPHPNYRIGAYADQNLSMNNAGSTVNLGNNTPLVGVFGAWNERLDGTGTEVKVSAAYGQKNTTVTRQVVGTSQPGSGGAPIDSQGAQVTAKYGIGLTENIIVSPYVGMRYTQNNMNGYTEAASSTVTAPLTYSALNTNATTALAGLGASYRIIPSVITFASAGVETDTNTSNGTYSATGVSGLTPINFNANPVKTRPTAMLGAYYDVVKNQRLGITGIYRQEPYQGVSTTTVMATYTVGL
jgi:autotransporter-associated beta strand protein